MPNAYLRYPSIRNNNIVFMSDDDLWKTTINGGEAIKLTSNLGKALNPKICPEGKLVAYKGSERGSFEVYIMPFAGGESTRLTWSGISAIIGWKDSKNIIFSSTYESFSRREGYLYTVNIETKEVKQINLGMAEKISYGENGRVALGRFNSDPARWKRYQGGTAGVIWIKDNKQTKFRQILKSINHNLTDPTWVGNRIYFISDHEGIANIYSVNSRGTNIKRHTHHDEYYCRNMDCDGKKIVYHCGADIFVYDLETKTSTKIEVVVNTPAVQAQERFESVERELDDYAVTPTGDQVAVVSRGKMFRMGPWANAPFLVGKNDERRYKIPVWLQDGKTLLAACADIEGNETLELFNTVTGKTKTLGAKVKWGKIFEIISSPKQNLVAVTNNKKELWLVDTKTEKAKLVDTGKVNTPSAPSWSHDGKYLAYTLATDQWSKSYIKIYNSKSKKVRQLLEPVYWDFNPVFDSSGDYLYFQSTREFVPNYNETHFDMGFPFAGRPYVVALRKDVGSPFEKHLKVEAVLDEKSEKGKKKKDAKEKEVEIDFDGIENRVLSFPLDFGGYDEIAYASEKLFYLKSEVRPLDPNNSSWLDDDNASVLYQFNFDEFKSEVFHAEVKSFKISGDGKQVILNTSEGLRLVSTSTPVKDDDKGRSKYDKKGGLIDLARIKLKIDPRAEWKQMYSEAWVLQREHFWTKDMSKIDWVKVFNRYLPLLDRVKTRDEMSDLLWEMQGELGTSHCYEFFGDYNRRPPYNPVGSLGAKFKFVPSKKAFEIEKIYKGDSWKEGFDSPLNATGVSLKAGDLVYEIDGAGFDGPQSLFKFLENKSETKVNLLVKRSDKKSFETVCIKTTSTDNQILYRQWVEDNKEYVRKKTKGKVGYVHIPDMSVNGYSEFYRNYLAECHKESLIVDVRYNGGGHVSQLIIKVLAQKVLGFGLSRWNGQDSYPMYAVNGPIVAVTNELAGSDGDIFSHAFKMAKIGKLIGKRTWGGVIGINGRYQLKDGTIVTQPEFSFYFNDCGFKVENHGTEPDIEVEITPEDWSKGNDPQLDRAILEVQKDAKKNPPVKPKLNKPNLSLPKLPKE